MKTKCFRDLSIKSKLGTIILLTGVFLLVLVSGALITNEVFSLKRNLSADLFTLADIMGSNSSVGLVFKNTQAAEDTLSSLKAKNNIIMGHIFTEEGELFASYYRDAEKRKEMVEYSRLEDHHFIGEHDIWDQNDGETRGRYFFEDDHVDIFKQIVLDGKMIGAVQIQSDLRELDWRLYRYGGIMLLVMLVSLALAMLLAARLQRIITGPVFNLLKTIAKVSSEQNYAIRAKKTADDEIGSLIDGFNHMLVSIERRDQEINSLNEQLTEENQRMGVELEVTRKLQQMVLPTLQDLQRIKGLDIAGFMEPATEVGGDYYDVLQHKDHIKIGIGDITGHGLESGVVMLMVQMAVRTLLTSNLTDPEVFLNTLNKAVFENVQRMHLDKNLTLSLLDYESLTASHSPEDGEEENPPKGILHLTGQHEEVLLVRKNGKVKRIDTIDLGFMVGIKPDIANFVARMELVLRSGDGVVLYTDGVTEAWDLDEEQYGVEALCNVINRHWPHCSSREIIQAVIADLKKHINGQQVSDDITLLVLKVE